MIVRRSSATLRSLPATLILRSRPSNANECRITAAQLASSSDSWSHVCMLNEYRDISSLAMVLGLHGFAILGSASQSYSNFLFFLLGFMNARLLWGFIYFMAWSPISLALLDCYTMHLVGILDYCTAGGLFCLSHCLIHFNWLNWLYYCLIYYPVHISHVRMWYHLHAHELARG